jgi:hypothetical protein
MNLLIFQAVSVGSNPTLSATFFIVTRARETECGCGGRVGRQILGLFNVCER